MNWPDFVEKSLRSEDVLPSEARCEIVRIIVQRMVEHKMTHDTDFTDVTEKALKRIPALNMNSASSNVSIFHLNSVIKK